MNGFIRHLETFICANNHDQRSHTSVFHKDDIEQAKKWQEMLGFNELGIDDFLSYRLFENCKPENHGVRIIEIPESVDNYLMKKVGSVPFELRWPLILGSFFRPDEFLPDNHHLKNQPIVVGEVERYIKARLEKYSEEYPIERHVVDYCFDRGVLPYEPLIQHAFEHYMIKKEGKAKTAPQIAAVG